MSRIYEFFSQEELQDLLEKATNNISQLEQELKRLKSQPLGYYDGTRELQSAHRDATEEAAKAHKRGWEQCQKEAVKAAKHSHHPEGCFCDWCRIAHSASAAIAAMEYGGKAND